MIEVYEGKIEESGPAGSSECYILPWFGKMKELDYSEDCVEAN